MNARGASHGRPPHGGWPPRVGMVHNGQLPNHDPVRAAMSGFQRTRGHTSGGGGGGLLGPTPRGNHGHHTRVVSRHGLLPPPALPVTTNPAAPFATASGHPRRDPGAGRYAHPLPPAYPQPRLVATGRRPASGRGGGAGAGAGGAATSAPRSGILPTPDSSRVNPLMAHVGDCQRELDQKWMQAFMRDQLSKPCASDDASTAQSPAAQHACVSVSEDQLAADRAYLWFCQSSIDPSVRAAVRYVCRAGLWPVSHSEHEPACRRGWDGFIVGPTRSGGSFVPKVRRLCCYGVGLGAATQRSRASPRTSSTQRNHPSRPVSGVTTRWNTLEPVVYSCLPWGCIPKGSLATVYRLDAVGSNSQSLLFVYTIDPLAAHLHDTRPCFSQYRPWTTCRHITQARDGGK